MSAVASDVLDEEYHHQLLRRWPQLAEGANIAEHWIGESCRDWVSPKAVTYMLNWKDLCANGKGGFVLRPGKHLPEHRCSVMAAAMFRVYKTARVLSLDALIEVVLKEGVPDIPMVLVPDFYVEGYTLTQRQMAIVYRFLSTQAQRFNATVLYIDDPKKMREAYGSAIADHINQSYNYEK